MIISPQAEAMRHGMELESPTDRLQEVGMMLWMAIYMFFVENYVPKNYGVFLQISCLMIQVHKEDLTAPPMGPPPSRKMTRTPPVSYQQQQVGVFISETKNRKNGRSNASKSNFKPSQTPLSLGNLFSRRREGVTKRKSITAGGTVYW